MFPLFRNFLKFAAAGAFVAMSASNPAGGDEMVQNLGPVGPDDTLLATVGSMRVIALSWVWQWPLRRQRSGLGQANPGLADAKSLLGISDSEAAAWKAYEDVSRANVRSLEAAERAMIDAERSGSAIDRMHAQTGMMQAQLDARKALQPATETLYKALTPERRERADAVLLLLGSTSGGGIFER